MPSCEHEHAQRIVECFPSLFANPTTASMPILTRIRTHLDNSESKSTDKRRGLTLLTIARLLHQPVVEEAVDESIPIAAAEIPAS